MKEYQLYTTDRVMVIIKELQKGYYDYYFSDNCIDSCEFILNSFSNKMSLFPQMKIMGNQNPTEFPDKK